MAKEQSFNLSPEKRELLARLLREKGVSDSRPSATIPARPKDSPPPLSFAQERLWYLEKLVPGNIAYNIPVAIRLKGSLNVAALRDSLNNVIARHEILRTTFDLEAINAKQTIQESLTIPLVVEDWTETAEPHDHQLQAALTAEAQQPFSLETGPLLRVKLVKLGTEHHIFLFTIHHIIADGWSLAIFFRELSAFYAAAVEGKTADLPTSVQYPDFAHWQRQRLSGNLLESQMSYWREQLGGDLPELVLPLDNPRPATPTFQGRWLSQSLPTAQLNALKSLAQSEGTTLFVVLLAAFKTLLLRYSGQEEIILGSPVTNRVHHDLENVIGHFINTLVLRTDLSGSITFRDLIKRQKQVVLDAYTNQDIPFEYLLDALQPTRDPRKNPLFQIIFNLQDVPAQAHWRTALDLPGIEAQLLFSHSQTAKLDLTVEIEVLDGALSLSFEYNSDIFSAETVERLIDHFQILLSGVATNPDKLLSAYSLMTAEELHTLTQWNKRETDFSEDQCIHILFESQVAKRPNAPALIQDDKKLTYAELNACANDLAHRLRQLGVGPDVIVGICARRSFAFITGVLAILKAGGAYAPIDVNYPKERINRILDNAQAPILLLEAAQAGKFTYKNGTTILLDEQTGHGQLSHPLQTENLPHETYANNLACILYTSGSTGEPKGVAIPHYAINRLVINTNHTTFEPDDVISHLSSVSFDASIYEIWGALLNGLPLAVATRETALVPDELAAFLEKHNVTILFMTTSLFNQAAYNRPDMFSHLRVVMFGGESGDPQAARIVKQNHSPQHLINVYGPTESTTYASWFPIQEVPEGAKTVPIGYPVANTTLYTLDKNLNHVPTGIPGEVYIGGKGLARGYNRQPGKSAAVFVPNPFSLEPGARLYKTGDLARFRPDPNKSDSMVLEFIGRIDNQVKIRGFRIEMGEIEAVISQFPAVQESYILVRDNGHGSRLVAYLVAKPGQTLSQLELRHFMQSHLPDYMMPTAFVTLDAFPLNTNGKVDWRNLPEPSLERPILETQFVAPQSEIEQTIAAIWQEVLQLQQVGRYDNFFDLGGNSLLLVKVHDRLQQTFERKIPIVQLFTSSTVADIAQYLGQQQDQGLRPDLPEIEASLERGKRRRARARHRS